MPNFLVAKRRSDGVPHSGRPVPGPPVAALPAAPIAPRVGGTTTRAAEPSSGIHRAAVDSGSHVRWGSPASSVQGTRFGADVQLRRRCGLIAAPSAGFRTSSAEPRPPGSAAPLGCETENRFEKQGVDPRWPPVYGPPDGFLGLASMGEPSSRIHRAAVDSGSRVAHRRGRHYHLKAPRRVAGVLYA